MGIDTFGYVSFEGMPYYELLQGILYSIIIAQGHEGVAGIVGEVIDS